MNVYLDKIIQILITIVSASNCNFNIKYLTMFFFDEKSFFLKILLWVEG
jgi:hypothetical protein